VGPEQRTARGGYLGMQDRPRYPKAAEVRKTLTPATPWADRDRAPKTDRVNVRISLAEKAEMAQMAESFGLGVSEYLLRLHRLTVAIRGSQRRDR
jgi:hypothetical protein